jgi:hypothetical protein
VKILVTLTFAQFVARNVESVSLSSFGTYFFVKEKFNENLGSIKPFTVDRLGKD